jgi:hypothetical protein
MSFVERRELTRNKKDVRENVDRMKHQSFIRLVPEIRFLVEAAWKRVADLKLESLILAQNERWRRALHMQVERGG